MEKSFMLNFLRKNLVINVLLIFLINNIEAQISGVVFRDFNGDGVLQTASASYEEPSISGITVSAYNAANTLVGTTTTSSTGTYAFSGLTLPVRIEFTGLPTGFYTSKVGSSNASSVQFYSAATTSANFAVNLPSEYSQPSTDKIAGVQMDNATTGTLNAIYTVPYGNTGNSSTGRANLSSSINPSSGLKVGAVWGLAYQPTTDRVFTSAFMRRFAAFGTGGTGAIYVTTNAKNNPASSATSLFINLNGMTVTNAAGGTTTISTGTDPHASNLITDLDNANGSPFDAVGKISFGDMDISDDKKYLYVVSLNDKKLYRITIDADNNINTNPTAADVLAYNLPSGGCTNGTARPFGLGIRNNEVYVGIICDAGSMAFGFPNNPQILPTSSQTATVYKLSGTTFSSVISFPMNYYRGLVSTGDFSAANDHRFRPWISTWTCSFPYYTTNSGRINYPQPMLSDIVFDVDGSMILGIGDRFAYQVANGIPNTNYSICIDLYLFDGRGGGDILRVCNTGTLNAPNYVLEGNAGCSRTTSSEVTSYPNSQPVEAEFYVGDNYDEGASPAHTETTQGALVMSYGSKRVVTTAFNPIDTDNGGGVFRNGFKYLSNVDGTDLNGYEINSTFGKCSGVGDLELLGNLAPIEIGNRVFMDTDEDGIQDAGEMGIANVTVKLFNAGVEVASTTTDANGQYLFANVSPNTAYEIRILAANIPSGKQLTLSNTGGGAAGSPEDMRDNDATLISSNAVISYTTGNAGQNDHTLDFGFKTVTCTFTTSINGLNSICNGQTAFLSLTNGVSYLWSTGQTTISITVGPTATTTYTVTVTDANNCTAVASKTVTVNLPTATAMGSSACVGGTLIATATGGTIYLWSGPGGFTATTASISRANATTSMNGLYFVTVTDANGCSAITFTSLAAITLPAVPTLTNSGPVCSGQSVNLTVSGLAPSGQAISLNGTNQYVNVVQDIPESNFTIETWVKTTATNGGIFGVRSGSVGSSAHDRHIGFFSGNLYIRVWNGTYWYTGVTINDNQWHHIALVVETGIGQRVYVDGIPVVTTNNYDHSDFTGQDQFSIGYSEDIGYLNGQIDNTRIWNVARTPQQIMDNMRLNTPASTTGLIANYLFSGNVNASIGVNGTTPNGVSYIVPAEYIYNWTGTNAPTSGSSETVTTTGAASGSYSVSYTKGACVSGTTSTTPTINSVPTPNISGTNTICSGASTTLTASGGTSYLWNTGATTAVITVSPTVTTTYSVTVTNVSGCSATANSTVTVNTSPTVTSLSLSVCFGGTINLSSSGGSSYVWSGPNSFSSVLQSPSIASATNLNAGTYTVTVTNTGGCTAIGTISVVVRALPSTSIDGITTICNGQSTTLTATGGGTYLWSTGSVNASIFVSPTVTTAYWLTVTSTVGCTASSSITVTVNNNPTVNIIGNGIVCSGQSTTLTASGGGTYLWNTGAINTSITVSPTVTTTYSVTATNASSCTATSTLTVTLNSISPTVSITSTLTTCNNYTLTANRGLGNAVEFTNSANKVDCGNATSVQITGTTLTLEALIYPKSWRTNYWEGSIINKESFDTKGYMLRVGNNGTISFALGTGTIWEDLMTSTSTLSLNTWYHIAATYDGTTMKIYLNGNLVASKFSSVIFANAGPNLIIGNWGPSNDRGFPGIIDEARVWNIARTQAQIAADMYRSIAPNSSGLKAYYKLDEGTGATTVDATGLGTTGTLTNAPTWVTPTGTPLNPVTYLWSTGATTSSITATQSGTYTVTVTNSYGCTASANIPITIVTTPATITGITAICSGKSTTLSTSGGGTYFWGTGSTAAAITVSPTVTTTYAVTITNVSGCTSTASITVTVNTAPVASIIGLVALCSSTSLFASGGGTYLWSNGATISSISVNPTVTTTYYVTVTNVSGCTSVDNIIASPNWIPTVTITGTPTICNGQSTTLTASGGGTYTWNTTATNPSISVSPTVTTTYSVTVINSVGCIATANQSVTVTTPPNAGTASPLSICKTEISATTDLFAQLAGEQTGGTWQSIAPYPSGMTSTLVDAKVSSGILQRKGFPAGAYTFRYTVIGTSPCPNDTEDVIITINSCCPPTVCMPTSSTRL